MNRHYNPYTAFTEDQREAIDAALFDLQLRLEDRRGWFTWMWILGVGAIGWVWFKAATETLWISQNGWHAAANLICGSILFVAGVSLRINAMLEMRHLKRMMEFASRAAPKL